MEVRSSSWRVSEDDLKRNKNFDVYKKKIYGAMCTRDFKNFTDITESVSVPVGHKHGTIFKASESDVKTLLEESKKK